MVCKESTLSTITKFILDLVFPTICVGCKKLDDRSLCDTCLDTISFQKDFTCAFCQARVKNGITCPFDRKDHSLGQLLVALSYEDRLVPNLIKTFKYSFIRDLGFILGSVMIDYMDQQIKNRVIDLNNLIVIPVPLSARRFRWRGFNQSEIIARCVAEYFNIPLAEDVLKRKSKSIWPFVSEQTQAGIKDRLDRIKNVKNIFLCDDPGSIKDKRILLIDDVSTTGSTLEECAKVLMDAGATWVTSFVLARGK